MADETLFEAEVEETSADEEIEDLTDAPLDGDAEAEAGSDDVPAGTDDGGDDGPILGPTPAEAPDEVPADEAAETPREKYARLLSEGCKPAQLISITDGKGQLVDVQLAWS